MNKEPIIGVDYARNAPPDVHTLKCWPEYFQAIAENRKTFEVRKADRDFKEGDVLHLEEWSPDTQEYTGRVLRAKIRYILHGGLFGIEAGYCVMGFIVCI